MIPRISKRNLHGDIMKLSALISVLVMTGVAVSVARADGTPASDTIGKVSRVYVAEARGLFIEKKLTKHTGGKEIWVDVRSKSMVTNDEVGELFKVPADMAIERGDLVATQAGDSSVRALNSNLIATPNQVTRLVAPHDSLIAMTFGLSQAAPPVLSAFLGAKTK
jgi:hypothetical protein